MKEIWVSRELYDKKPRLLYVLILYAIRLGAVIFLVPLIVIEPHTFQGYGYTAVDYTLLLVPWGISIVTLVCLVKKTPCFLYCVYVLAGCNLVLFILTLSPYFIEESTILPFLAGIDCAMIIYLFKSKYTALYYRYREIRISETSGDIPGNEQ